MPEYHDLWLPKNGAESDPSDFDMRGTPYHVPHRLYGQGIEAMFPGGKLTAMPHSSGPANLLRLRNVNGHDPIRETLIASVRGEVHPQHIDPRWLKMTQSAVTRPGVRYYAEDPTYHETGETYADKGNVGNMVPVIYQHSDWGVRLILSGHHRAAAALAMGKPLKALVIDDRKWK
jgi:hypothetical protein